MHKMGFSKKCVTLVMQCLSTVTYAIRINGVPKGHIIPSRELRQGDPLLPYLFLLCAEGLSAMLHQAVHEKRLRAVSICRRGPKISHLFFADNSVIFGRATEFEVLEMLRILKVYEDSSGQQLNKQKTSLFFSKNIMGEIQNKIKTMFGAQMIKQHETYLSLPSLVRRSKTNSFCSIKDQGGSQADRMERKAPFDYW